MTEDQQERQLAELERVTAFLASRIAPAEAIYRQSITSLWLGNGAAAAGVLSFLAATAKDGSVRRAFLVPLAFFTFGLISLAGGSFFFLLKEARAIRAIEPATSVLDVPAGTVRRPSAAAGLSFADPRTISALIASALFVFGCLAGFVVLANGY